MKKHSIEAVEEKVLEVFAKSYEDYTKPEIKVSINPEIVMITIKRMYEYVELNFSHLMALAEFFETKNINDSRYAYGGCETCDYGSSYEITLTVRPEGP